MSVKYGKFEMPDKIKLDEASQSATFARFIIEPFERGFGHTVGSALRRIMLASLEAPSIISERITPAGSRRPNASDTSTAVADDMPSAIINTTDSMLSSI